MGHFVLSLLSFASALCLFPHGAAGRAYTYYNYESIVKQLHELEANYPDIIQVSTAQDDYNLPSPGNCGSSPCKQWIVRVTNEETLPAPERPEVFFSGELHGNERIGPTTIMEMLELLATSYYGGVNGNPWLNHLVDTRIMYFMPATNALGYYNNRRGERGVDPNRDFPIDNLNGNCMRTVAARALNELWREHLFQLAITFHGGMRAIAYEWGTLSNHYSRISPDDAAQVQIGTGLSDFAGKFREGHYYPHNRLNDIVYPVRGGMEDWAYAGSWAKNARPCTPNTFGGYPASKTTYSKGQLRAFNILVETSNRKTPRVPDLGSDEELLLPNGKGNGHIPQNVRLALLTADVVQPYMVWINGHRGCAKGSLLAPNLLRGSSCGKTPPLEPLTVGKGSVLTLSWDIGGGFHVDSTRLVIAKWPENVPFDAAEEQGHQAFPGFGLSERELQDKLEIVNMSEPQQGTTRWVNVRSDKFADRAKYPFFPSWSDCIAAPEVPGRYVVFAVTEMDRAWGKSAPKSSPHLGPQSHIVNARTNPSWNVENAGHKIVGRVRFYSVPLRLVSAEPPIKTTGSTDAPKSCDYPVETAGLGIDCKVPMVVPPYDTSLRTNSNQTSVNKKEMLRIAKETVFYLRVRSVYFGFLAAFALVLVFHYCTRRNRVRYEPLQSTQ